MSRQQGKNPVMETINLTPEQRRERVKELRAWQQPVFDTLGIPDAVYIPKPLYPTNNQLCVHFFINELKGVGTNDIYVESVKKKWVPEYHLDDPRGNGISERPITNNEDRRLFLWKYDSNWGDYPVIKNNLVTVPVSNLVYIDRDAILADLIPESEFNPDLSFEDIMDPDNDCPPAQFTGRDEIAIRCRIPVASKKWINDIIIKFFPENNK